MPLHVRKKAAQALLEFFFLESNHSLSTDPFLPSSSPHPPPPLPPPPSNSDHHSLTSTGAQSGGKNTAGEDKDKPTMTSK